MPWWCSDTPRPMDLPFPMNGGTTFQFKSPITVMTALDRKRSRCSQRESRLAGRCSRSARRSGGTRTSFEAWRGSVKRMCVKTSAARPTLARDVSIERRGVDSGTPRLETELYIGKGCIYDPDVTVEDMSDMALLRGHVDKLTVLIPSPCH